MQEKSPITAFSGYNLVIVHLLVNLGWVRLGGGGGGGEVWKNGVGAGVNGGWGAIWF